MSSTVVDKRINTDDGLAYYTGTVNAEGAPHGRGSYVIVKGEYKGSSYEGTFVDGERDGFGKYTWNDGSVFVGEFEDGDLNGFALVCLVLCFLFSLI